MAVKEIVAVVAAALGAMGFGAAVGVAVVRYVFRDWTDWRERVERKIDRLQPEHIMKIEGFDPERLELHYARLNGLATVATECKLGLENAEHAVSDHEQRIRHLEAERVARET